MQLRDAELSAMMNASSSFDLIDDDTSSLRVGAGAPADRYEEQEEELEGSREHISVDDGLPSAFHGSPRANGQAAARGDSGGRRSEDSVHTDSSFGGSGSSEEEDGQTGGAARTGRAPQTAGRQELAVAVPGGGCGGADEATKLIDAQAEIDVLRSSLELPPSPARAHRMHLAAAAHSPAHSAAAQYDAGGHRSLVSDEDDEDDPGAEMLSARGNGGGGVLVANAQLAAALSAHGDLRTHSLVTEPEPESDRAAGQMLDLSRGRAVTGGIFGSSDGRAGGAATHYDTVGESAGAALLPALDIDGDESPVLTYGEGESGGSSESSSGVVDRWGNRQSQLLSSLDLAAGDEWTGRAGAAAAIAADDDTDDGDSDGGSDSDRDSDGDSDEEAARRPEQQPNMTRASHDEDAAHTGSSRPDSGQQVASAAGGQGGDSHRLPAGWSAHYDGDTSCFYYFHAPTQTSSWTRPTAAAAPAAAAASHEPLPDRPLSATRQQEHPSAGSSARVPPRGVAAAPAAAVRVSASVDEETHAVRPLLLHHNDNDDALAHTIAPLDWTAWRGRVLQMMMEHQKLLAQKQEVEAMLAMRDQRIGRAAPAVGAAGGGLGFGAAAARPSSGFLRGGHAASSSSSTGDGLDEFRGAF